MSWTLIEETPGPLMRWQARLTRDRYDSSPLSLALIENPVIQIEGNFGEAAVELRGSNSGQDYVSFDMRQHADIVAVLPTLYFKAVAVDADETTDVLVTIVGRR